MEERTAVQTVEESTAPLAVEMRDISKAWPGVLANDHINLAIERGEIHALVGENGAGKSTLMNILYGLIKPDSGEIFVNGQKASIHKPHDAIRLGIGMVHQHFMLIPPLTVAENIVLGHEPGGLGGLYDSRKARREILALSERYGLPIDPDARIEKLSIGLQQRVEILKVLHRGADILIMDEPTGVLTPQETDDLFKVIRGLVTQGKTVIFITHKLREVLELTDTVTVLRRGKNAGNLVTRETNQAEIARLMVGREVLLRVQKEPAKPGPVVLGVRDLHAQSDRGLEALHGLNFEVRAGEILGIAGVEGNGQSELVEVLTGMRKATEGSITVTSDGRERNVTGLNANGMRLVGMAHIPEDRRGSGLVVSDTIEDNCVLGRQRWSQFSWRGLLLNLVNIARWARKLIADFDVRTPSTLVAAQALSGGNQQKVIIARELGCNPLVLVASQPTR
ncbi:MAG: ABC transporter ATP-binding protein, partial [Ktedonobacteraceae bacterium]|nr:ABC transporter ATP-binding protein [Ktedonobacteraceae bacterium]